MSNISISATLLESPWRGSTTTPEVRVYANQTFVTSDNTEVLFGSPTISDSPYVSFTITLIGTAATISSSSLDSTTDSLVPATGGATYSAYIFSNGVLRDTFLADFQLPATPTPTSWGSIFQYQPGPKIRLETNDFYTKIQSDSRYLTTAGVNPPATTTQNGMGTVDTTPADPAHPEFVGSNSPRVAQKAIVGTDNATTDTAALQAAITALGVNGGVIRTLGTVSISASSLTFPTLTNSLVFEVYGSWRLATTLVLPNNVHWKGLGGAQNLQFQKAGPTAGIIPPSVTIPALHITGIAAKTVSNLAINGGGGIYIGGAVETANVEFWNIASIPADGSGKDAFTVDGAFWVWFRECAFLSYASNPYSLRINNSPTSIFDSGLIYIDDSIFSGKGIRVESEQVVNTCGNIFIRNCHYENANNEFLSLDGTNSNIQHILLDQVNISDAIGIPSMITTAGTGTISNITIENSSAQGLPMVSGTVNIKGLNIYGSQETAKIGDGQREWTSILGEQFDGRWSGAGASMAPSIVPYASLNVNQDCSTWGALSGSATVTTGIIAPDGSATAAKLTSASGIQERTVFYQTLSVAVGDYVIAGVWMKAESATAEPWNGLFAFLTGSVKIDGSNNGFFGVDAEYASVKDSSWTLVVVMGKVTSTTLATADYVFSLQATPTQPTSYWKPWAIRIPAGTMDEKDVVRLKRMLGNVVSNLPAGAVAMYPHQTLYAGRIVSQVVTVFTDADTTPSVVVGNEFTATNTAPTSITTFDDGVDTQLITILFTNGNTTLVDGATLQLAGGANFVGTADDMIVLKKRGNVWFELSRSVN